MCVTRRRSAVGASSKHSPGGSIPVLPATRRPPSEDNNARTPSTSLRAGGSSVRELHARRAGHRRPIPAAATWVPQPSLPVAQSPSTEQWGGGNRLDGGNGAGPGVGGGPSIAKSYVSACGNMCGRPVWQTAGGDGAPGRTLYYLQKMAFGIIYVHAASCFLMSPFVSSPLLPSERTVFSSLGIHRRRRFGATPLGRSCRSCRVPAPPPRCT